MKSIATMTKLHPGTTASSKTKAPIAAPCPTIAIVFSVCVGVCGYLLQAWTAEKASRHAGDLQREHDQQARDRQVEQDRTVAQIRRTERWVDDFCSPIGRALTQYILSRNRFGKSHCR